MPAFKNDFPLSSGTGAVKVRLNCINAGQSIEASGATPRFTNRFVESTTSATPTSTFLGSQPRKAQVPPKGLESIIATSHPALRHSYATVDAAEPVPMT